MPNGPDRLREAAKHGLRQAIVPKANVPLTLTESALTEALDADISMFI